MERIEAKIKGSVDETTSSVRRMVDVRYQVSQHPWAALGVAVLAGVALGSMGDDSSRWGGSTSSMSTADAYQNGRNLSPYPAGYGAGSYGSSGYGSQGYGAGSYGPSSYGSQGYGSQGYGPSSYGSQGYGSQGYGPSSYGPSSYGSQGHSQQSYTSPSYEQFYGYPSGSSGGTAAGSYSGSYGNAYAGSSPSYAGQSADYGQRNGLREQITQQFGGEIEALKGAAVTSLVSLLRDTIRQSFPSLHEEMERLRRQQGAAEPSQGYAASSATSRS